MSSSARRTRIERGADQAPERGEIERRSAAATELQALLVFALGPHRFALPAASVREIVRAVAISALPGAPEVVEGVVNYRGRIVPVADPRCRFGLDRVPLQPDQHFVVAVAGSRWVALRVDRALELRQVLMDTVEWNPGSIAPSRYVAGVARLPDGLLVIHDLEQFLSLDEAARVDRAISALAVSRTAGPES
ncbi:MAG TPA: chemotaxis protein CheW [Gemmatimonadales bacterium]|nr:chemotaxis protein CheW [Gemmatimonadales bacterium]